MSSEMVTLDEGTKILKSDKETAKVLNNFFSDIVQNLKIPEYKEQDQISASISDSVMRAVVKYRVHHSIIALKENCNSNTPFNFSFVNKEDILKEIKKLKANKATQNTEIATKLINENSDIFADFIFGNLNQFSNQHIFPNINMESEKVSVHHITCYQCSRNGNHMLITKTYLVFSSRIFQRHLTVSHMTF